MLEFFYIKTWKPRVIVWDIKSCWSSSLGKTIISIAVEVFIWIWNTFSLSIKKGKSLIEIWTVFKFFDIKSL